MPAVFERKEDESEEQWEAYRSYRDAGLSRSVANLSKPYGVSKRTIQRWAKKYDWDRRVQVYDDWKTSTRVKVQAEAIVSDTLSDLEKVLTDLIQIAKAETSYKKKLWSEYWRDIQSGETPKSKPPASSTRSIAELIQSIASINIQLKSLKVEDDDILNDIGEFQAMVRQELQERNGTTTAEETLE
ncbi:MAG: hypothetical protein V1862_06135 [Methanobacteriota archaeon]